MLLRTPRISSALMLVWFVALLNVTLLHAREADNPNVLPQGSISVIDDFGRVVELDRPASRIVALSPHIVENLFSVGLGERIVATVDFADFPARAGSIPRLGGFSNFSVEAVLSARPDLVVGWGSGYAQFGELLSSLESLGIPVYVDEPRKLKDVRRSLLALGVLGGKKEQAEQAVQHFDNKLLALENRGQRLITLSRMPKVFYPIWPKPLQTLNGEHIVSDVIQLCGGENIFAGLKALAPVINMESVLLKNPDLIVASASDGNRPDWLRDFSQWPEVDAVARQQLYFIDGDLLSRHTLRMLEGAELMCDYIEQAAGADSD